MPSRQIPSPVMSRGSKRPAAPGKLEDDSERFNDSRAGFRFKIG
jgi:hypothetical protein